MGKTLGSILLIAAAVVINVVPGVGQAISGAILSTVGTSFAAVGIVSTALSVVGFAVTAAGLQSLAKVVGIGPKAPKPAQTETSIKSPNPDRVSAYGRIRLFLAYALYETAEDGTAVDVGAVHEGKIDAYEQFYLGDDKVTLTGSTVNTGADGRYKGGVINLYTTLGEATETAYAAVISLLGGIWTSSHRGDGVASLAMTSAPVKAKHYQDVYPNGLPPSPSAVIRAQLVYDWRDPGQDVDDPSTWAWSENVILHIAHYRLVREGKDWATHFAPTLSYWTAAANDADVAMPLKAGGTEPRYRSCLAHKHTDPHKDVLTALLSCCDGWMAPRSDGAIVIFSGRYYAPTVTIGPDEIVSYTYEDGIEDEESANEIALTYISAPHDFNAVETDAWRNEADIAARGRVNSISLANQVPSHAQARRLAKRYMAKLTAQQRGTVTTNTAGRVARGQRYIHLTIDEGNGYAPFDGPVEITQMTRNISTGGVTFVWVSTGPEIDDWNPAAEEGDPAPVGERVAGSELSAPTISSATPDFSDIGNSDSDGISGGIVTGVRINIGTTAPDRADLTWFARWSVGGGPWSERECPDVTVFGAVSFTTEYVPYGTNVDIQIAYSYGDGRISAWSATETVDTSP
jgi:hypothetical protein